MANIENRTKLTQSADFAAWVKELKHEFPELKGFSRRNMYAILQWYKFYSTKYQFVPHGVAQIPWTHNDTMKKEKILTIVPAFCLFAGSGGNTGGQMGYPSSVPKDKYDIIDDYDTANYWSEFAAKGRQRNRLPLMRRQFGISLCQQVLRHLRMVVLQIIIIILKNGYKYRTIHAPTCRNGL